MIALHDLSAHELSTAYRTRRLSPVEVTRAVLSRIDAWEKRINALRRVQLQGDETIAIFGQGPVGLSATQLAVEMGARVIAIDIAPERRKLAQQFGAAEVIDPTAHDMVAAIRELTHGEGAHKTLDASSASDARAAAVRSLRSWGTACFVGERVRSRSTSARISCAGR